MAKPSRPGHRLASILLWALAPAVAASACGSGSSSPPTSPTSASVTSVNISGTANFTEAGQTAQLAATATFSDNTKQDVTATAAWRSLNASVATVSGTGLVTALGLGAASITATFQGKSATLPVSVTASHGQIATCGVFSGPGPFTVATDIRATVANCLAFSDDTSVQLDCQGHEVSSITLSNVQGFSIRNCVLSAGVNMTLKIVNSRQVLVDSTTVVGSVFVQASQGNTFNRGTFRWPLLPSNPNSFESGEMYFSGGQNNTVTNSTIDGGWDGNFATYQHQGCDDGILIQNEVNSVVRSNVITNVFDAAVESGVSQGPITTTIEGNTISHAGYTGIGGYYVQGWQNSSFSGNTVTNTPSILEFNTSGVSPSTTMTLVNNRFVNNRLQNPVPLPPQYGGGLAPSLFINYAAGGRPTNVSGNLIQDNDFGTSTPAPVLAPANGFIDGGGNFCQPGGVLACHGLTSTLMAQQSIIRTIRPWATVPARRHSRRQGGGPGEN